MSDENQNVSTDQTETQETVKTTSPGGLNVHAVVLIDGYPGIWSFKTKKDLAKALADHPGAKVIGSFKGKKLVMKEKKSYSFC